MHGRKIFLPEQPDGQVQINHDPAFDDTTRICRKIESRRKITQWIHICKGNKGNVQTPPSRMDRTRRPVNTSRAVWIKKLKQTPRTMETQQLTNKLYLGSQ